PHHENELAQSRAAGRAFANYWLHNAWVTTAGEKMSKSLGNSLVVEEVLKRVRPVELRWYLVSAHYRSNLEFSDQALAESAASYQRIEGFLTRAAEYVEPGGEPDTAKLPTGFVDAMNDDLGVPAGLAVLHETVTTGNRALASGDSAAAQAAVLEVRAMLDVLGVDPLSAPWNSRPESDTEMREALDSLVRSELAARQVAREQRDFVVADTIRDRIAAAGIVVEDTADGARWSLAGES
ncbi:MAG: class I tRNA ligase family protein, partial [Actinobacteria bacterium]|nr:class I tRNA ligase family protein [Actinomycetota bacterium]